MRAKLLGGVVAKILGGGTPGHRRSLGSFTPEERQRFRDTWDRVQRYPKKSTRAELESYDDDVVFLKRCACCSGQATGTVPGRLITAYAGEEFDIPICEACLESPFTGE